MSVAGYRKVKTKDELKKNQSLNNSKNGGKIVSGAVSGGLAPDSKEGKAHAVQYYESVRKMKTDCANISKNTGIPEKDIRIVKSFIFEETHDLGGTSPKRFEPSYRMAESWRRLIDGKNIKPHDLTLLKHEIMERNLINKGYSQEEAHIITSLKYNYKMESDAYYAKINKHKKR